MEIFVEQSVLLYVMVFVGKIINNMLVTLKTIILNRGERFKAALITLIQTGLFIVITGSVLAGLTTDIIRVVVYLAAAMIGNYIGTIIESKLAFGISSIQVIVPEEHTNGTSLAEELAAKLRDEEFAVTILDGEGDKGRREVLLLHLKRKRITKAKAIIHSFLNNAVIVENEVKTIQGGFITKHK